MPRQVPMDTEDCWKVEQEVAEESLESKRLEDD